MINKIKGYLGYDVELYDLRYSDIHSLDILALEQFRNAFVRFGKRYILNPN